MNADGLALVSAIFSPNSPRDVHVAGSPGVRVIMNRMAPVTNRILHRRRAVTWIPIRATSIYFS
jgi:hypothetical protein